MVFGNSKQWLYKCFRHIRFALSDIILLFVINIEHPVRVFGFNRRTLSRAISEPLSFGFAETVVVRTADSATTTRWRARTNRTYYTARPRAPSLYGIVEKTALWGQRSCWLDDAVV